MDTVPVEVFYFLMSGPYAHERPVSMLPVSSGACVGGFETSGQSGVSTGVGAGGAQVGMPRQAPRQTTPRNIQSASIFPGNKF